MRISITGSSPDHCGEYDRHSSGNLSWSLLQGLEAAGHEVWKSTGYSSQADLQVVFFDPFDWGENIHVIGALMALGKRLQNQQPVMVGFSDNMFYRARDHFTTYLGPVLFKKRFGGLSDRDQRFIRDLLERFSYEDLPTAFVQTFPWVDTLKLKKILRVQDVKWLDPSALEPRPWVHFGKRRRWVFGTNKPMHAWWPDGEWPVDVYSKVEGTWVPRETLFHEYACAWGVLAQRYTYADVGWWRNRYIHAAGAGAILLMHPAEAKPLPKFYKVSREEVESLEDKELGELADRQRAWLFQRVWDRETFVYWADRAVNEAVL